jgi:glycosyl hydrolase family 141
VLQPIEETGFALATPGASLPAWTNPSEIEAVTLSQWKMMSCPVASIEGGTIAMQQPCWTNANVYPDPWQFHLLSRLENAYEFLDEPGEWYLDSASGWLYYMPRADEDLSTADVELPVVEVLLQGAGELGRPVAHLRFEGLTFAYATWLGPSGPNGYVADQSGFFLVGDVHGKNVIGHDPDVVRTPGNVSFRYAQHVEFRDDDFVHLGAVGLDFDTGSQDSAIVDDLFEDISSAAVQLGGVTTVDHHPTDEAQITRDNQISNNLIHSVGREYVDAAGIYVGFTTRTLVSHNDIVDVPWSGIAIGWGWGLFDRGSFPGLPHAVSGQWGQWDTPTTSRGNRLLANRIEAFLGVLWDGGAIYSNGAQGTSFADGERIAGNVASGKRVAAGGNTFYTDGGSRWVTLSENVSLDDPQGKTDFGPCGWASSLDLCKVAVPYGADAGGCVPYGDLRYDSNYFRSLAFYDICSGPPAPVDIEMHGEHLVTGENGVPERILRAAGRRPSARWRRLGPPIAPPLPRVPS